MIEWVANLRNKNLLSFISKSHENCKEAHIDTMIDLYIGSSQRNFGIVQLGNSLSERRHSNWRNIAMMSFIFDAFLDDLVPLVYFLFTSLWHLELFLSVNGRITAHEADWFFLLIFFPSFELVHELAEWKVDIVGKIGNMKIHNCE